MIGVHVHIYIWIFIYSFCILNNFDFLNNPNTLNCLWLRLHGTMHCSPYLHLCSKSSEIPKRKMQRNRSHSRSGLFKAWFKVGRHSQGSVDQLAMFRWLMIDDWCWFLVSAMNMGLYGNIFHNIWDIPSHWLIFFKMVKSTNQLNCRYLFLVDWKKHKQHLALIGKGQHGWL